MIDKRLAPPVPLWRPKHLGEHLFQQLQVRLGVESGVKDEERTRTYKVQKGSDESRQRFLRACAHARVCTCLCEKEGVFEDGESSRYSCVLASDRRFDQRQRMCAHKRLRMCARVPV